MPTGDGTSAGGPASLGAKQRAEALIGHVVADRYRIERILAMGGMGAVFAGEHVHLHKDVAIKLLHPETKGLPELVARFERESMVGAHASHRNVAGATDFGKDADGSYYLICELVDGINLKTLMKQGPIPLERAVDIARQIAEGLHAIHELDIVHRDLNPRNVMVSKEPPDRVKLIDFGFAKVPVGKFDKKARRRGGANRAGGEDPKPMSLTAEGMVFGTVGFMAPEAAFGMAAVDKPADLYALGVILYEMLTGKHPFDAEGQKALFKCHAMDEPPPFAERVPDRSIPAVYETITMKLLEKDPAERYGTATDVLDALDEAIRAPVTSGTTTREQLTDDDQSPWTQRRAEGGKGRLGVIVALVLVVAAGVVLSQRSIRERLLGATPTPPSPPSGAVTVAPPTGAPEIDVPEPTATATATSTAAPRPTAIAGLDADAWVAKLRQAVAGKSVAHAAEAIQAIADIDPDRLGGSDLVAETALAVVSVSLTPDADTIFELLGSDRVGAAGPDVLYRLVAFHGGSKAAQRAEKLLAEEAVWNRASDAMKIAQELRTTPCQKRTALLERAAEVGDRRALLLLSNMTPRDCSTCCLHAPGLGPAIRKLNERLKSP